MWMRGGMARDPSDSHRKPQVGHGSTAGARQAPPHSGDRMADAEHVEAGTERESREHLAAVLGDRYTEIRGIAAAALRRERVDHTLQATAVANEVWLRLAGSPGVRAEDPIAFRSLVATVVRHILVDHARARNGPKRGEGWRRVPLVDLLTIEAHAGHATEIDIVDLDAMIERLRAIAPRQAQVVEMRLFGGFSHGECARRLDVSLATVELDWKLARHWLRSSLFQEER
jgi:RNA polymerase sigma-70 factor (ECF subfamily)